MAQGPLQPGSQIGADGPKAHKGHTLDLHKASLLFSEFFFRRFALSPWKWVKSRAQARREKPPHERAALILPMASSLVATKKTSFPLLLS